MIDYEKVLTFCHKYNISFEEFMLLYTLHMRNQQYKTHLHETMSEYYQDKEINWIKTVNSLQERGFLEKLRDQKDPKRLLIKDLRITEKFVNLLFVDPDEIWKKFLQRYPSRGFSPTGNSEFGANIVKENDKEYFMHNILKNADREEANNILSYLEQMFDYDENLQTPNLPAQFGVSRFLRNWDEILRQFLYEQNLGGGKNWSSKMI